MNNLLEQLEENEAKLRLLKQDVDRIKINPIYSLSLNSDELRTKDLLRVKKKLKRTFLRRHDLLLAVADNTIEELEQVQKTLIQLKA